MRKVFTEYDDVVGKIMYQADGNVVTEVAVSAPIACVEDRTDRRYVGGFADHVDDVTFVKDSSADVFWKGCSNSSTTATRTWTRSSNALEFGAGKDFVYVSDGANDRTKTVRIYGTDGDNTAVRISWLVLNTDEYGERTRIRLELWRNNGESRKGRLLKVKEFDGYTNLGYDRSVSAGYELRDHATRVILFWLAFAAYGN